MKDWDKIENAEDIEYVVVKLYGEDIVVDVTFENKEDGLTIEQVGNFGTFLENLDDNFRNLLIAVDKYYKLKINKDAEIGEGFEHIGISELFVTREGIIALMCDADWAEEDGVMACRIGEEFVVDSQDAIL